MSTEYERIAELLEELLGQEKHRFPQKRQPLDAPEKHGVYIIRKNDTVRHVGRTLCGRYGLRQRLADHLAGNSSFVRDDDDFNGEGARLRGNGYTYQYLVVECPRKRALLEALAAGTLCPAHVGTGDRQARSNQAC